jgi:polyphosphate kinase 2 (PPK2 family)
MKDKEIKKLIDRLIATPGKKISLEDYDADWTGSIKDKSDAEGRLQEGVRRLAKTQDKLYAQDKYALLVIFQAMDAAGKDGTIRHVMSGVNPQGCQVFSFKAPSAEERDHDYLWRSSKALPERGRIGIHNRSYYEEVLVCRVHPELLEAQNLPDECKDKEVWKRRFREINHFEQYLVDNGIVILKFYLNVSKKFSVNDARERQHWDDYMEAYEDVFTHTSTDDTPWYIIPADNKWFMRYAVAAIINHTLEKLDLKYPTLTREKKNELLEARKVLLAEKD